MKRFAPIILMLVATACSSKPTPETLCSSADTQAALKNALTQETAKFDDQREKKKPWERVNPLILEMMMSEAKFSLIKVDGYNDENGRAECSGTVEFKGDFNPKVGPPSAIIDEGGTASDDGASLPIAWKAQKLANEDTVVVQLKGSYGELMLWLYAFEQIANAENKSKK